MVPIEPDFPVGIKLVFIYFPFYGAQRTRWKTGRETIRLVPIAQSKLCAELAYPVAMDERVYILVREKELELDGTLRTVALRVIAPVFPLQDRAIGRDTVRLCSITRVKRSGGWHRDYERLGFDPDR